MNKKVLFFVMLAVLVATAVISWLMFGGHRPGELVLDSGVKAKFNATLRDTDIIREKDGKLLWKFRVAEVMNDRTVSKTIFKGITGKVYRQDGSYLDITADAGEMMTGSQNFEVSKNVVARHSLDGSKLTTDRMLWNQKENKATAIGNVKMWKGEWFVSADKAEGKNNFQNVKLIGRAFVERR